MRRRTLALVVALMVTVPVAGCSGAQDRPGAEVAGPSPAGASGTPPELRMPQVPPPDACAVATLRAMSLRQQAGQLVLVGVGADGPDQAVDVVERHGVAGVFLRGRTTRPLADLRRRVDRLNAAARAGTEDAAAPGLFVAVDQEGGVVRTLRGPGFTDVPAADEQARMSVARVRALTREWAAELAAAGVNLDLAPVADTVPAGREESNPPIGVHGRHFGSYPADVATRVSAVSAALRSHDVLPTVKHFPGLGRVRVNTDTGRGAVDRTADVGDPHLAPFAAGVRAGAGAVMVSSATYPRLDRRHPAMFSPAVIHDLLRSRLGWNGLVVSDDVAIAEAVRHVPLWRRAVDFVAAGGDLVLTVRSEYAGPLVAALVLRAERDADFRARVAQSAGRVLQAKRSVGLLRC